jgi:hypothetical protein
MIQDSEINLQADLEEGDPFFWTELPFSRYRLLNVVFYTGTRRGVAHQNRYRGTGIGRLLFKLCFVFHMSAILPDGMLICEMSTVLQIRRDDARLIN